MFGREDMNLSTSKAAVVGGAGGIGTAVVGRLLDEGSRVAVIDCSEENLERLRDQYAYASEQMIVDQADVTDASYPERFERTLEKLGGVDLLIYAAGILIDGVIVGLGPGGMISYSQASWRRQVDVNLTGAFISAQIVASQMIRTRTRGCLTFFSSVSRLGRAGQGCYGATKAGVASLATSLARELAPYGIRAFSVAPGLTETDMAMSVPEGRRSEFVESVLAQRMASADEIAHATVEAIRNDYVCATVVEVHGGYLGN